jgi:DHA2 family multidrug resistance protein
VVTAGLVMGPRGFGTIVAMLIYGRASNLVDQRLFVLLGLSIISITMYRMSGWSLDVDAKQFIELGVIQGFGMGLTFAPMTALAFSTLSPPLRTEASSFYSLVRNVGGAVGISIVISRLSELTQTNHAHLGAFMTPFRHFPSLGSLSGPGPLKLLDLGLTRQAGMIAYVNVFRLLAFVTLTGIPFLALVRPASSAKPATAAAPAAASAAAH